MQGSVAEPHRGALVPRVRDSKPRAGAHRVYLPRGEFRRLMGMFSRMSKAGTWHDYSLQASSRETVFRVYRRARDLPAYTLVRSNDSGRKVEWQVRQYGKVLKRSSSLDLLLAWLEVRALPSQGY